MVQGKNLSLTLIKHRVAVYYLENDAAYEQQPHRYRGEAKKVVVMCEE